MILILSNSGDLSTDLVIDWLEFYQYPYLRINSYDLLEENTFLDLSQKSFTIKGKAVEFEKFGTVWFRKFGTFMSSIYYKELLEFMPTPSVIQIYREFNVFNSAFLTLIRRDVYWLTHPNSSSLNKIRILKLAQDLGITVPTTYVVSTKKQLLELCQKYALITKSIVDPFFIHVPEGMYSMYTKSIKTEDVEKFSDTFMPSLVQEKVEKEYELRIFYLDGQFYSMVIFSQQDQQTQADFRLYNWSRPNRFVPYELPQDLQEKLHLLMKEINLNCGSIDVMKGIDGKYYFLEINPTGQFGMTSEPCNYNLHQLVAQHLIKKDKEKI